MALSHIPFAFASFLRNIQVPCRPGIASEHVTIYLPCVSGNCLFIVLTMQATTTCASATLPTGHLASGSSVADSVEPVATPSCEVSIENPQSDDVVIHIEGSHDDAQPESTAAGWAEIHFGDPEKPSSSETADPSTTGGHSFDEGHDDSQTAQAGSPPKRLKKSHTAPLISLPPALPDHVKGLTSEEMREAAVVGGDVHAQRDLKKRLEEKAKADAEQKKQEIAEKKKAAAEKAVLAAQKKLERAQAKAAALTDHEDPEPKAKITRTRVKRNLDSEFAKEDTSGQPVSPEAKRVKRGKGKPATPNVKLSPKAKSFVSHSSKIKSDKSETNLKLLRDAKISDLAIPDNFTRKTLVCTYVFNMGFCMLFAVKA